MKKLMMTMMLLGGILLSNNNYAETNFQYAYKKLLSHEGNYAYHPLDKGGETYRGITKRFNKNWYGWRYVNAVPNKKQYQEIEKANFWAQDHFLDIWVKEGFDKIKDKQLASYLFDYRVNAYTGPKELRKVLNEVGLCIPIKNKFTDEVAECINVAPNWLLKNRLEHRRKQHYYRIVNRDPSQRIFLKHWLQRTKMSNY